MHILGVYLLMGSSRLLMGDRRNLKTDSTLSTWEISTENLIYCGIATHSYFSMVSMMGWAIWIKELSAIVNSQKLGNTETT